MRYKKVICHDKAPTMRHTALIDGEIHAEY